MNYMTPLAVPATTPRCLTLNRGQRVRVTAGGYSDEEGEIVAVNPDGTYDVTTDALWTLRRYPGRSLAPVGKA